MDDPTVFDEELAFFEEHRAEWCKDHLGQTALVKARECFGFFDSDEDAYWEGRRLFGGELFLLHDVFPYDPVVSVPSFSINEELLKCLSSSEPIG